MTSRTLPAGWPAAGQNARMRLGHRITGLCLALVTVGLGVPPAQAEDPPPTTLT